LGKAVVDIVKDLGRGIWIGFEKVFYNYPSNCFLSTPATSFLPITAPPPSSPSIYSSGETLATMLLPS
jgi:hypothetical protein